MWEDEQKRLLSKIEKIKNSSRLEEIRNQWFYKIQYVLSNVHFGRTVRYLKAFMGEADYMNYVYDANLATKKTLNNKRRNQWEFYITQKYTQPGNFFVLKFVVTIRTTAFPAN